MQTMLTNWYWSLTICSCNNCSTDDPASFTPHYKRYYDELYGKFVDSVDMQKG